MVIHSYEKSGRGQTLKELLASCAALSSYRSVMILPIPTTKDGRTLNGTEVPLSGVPPLAPRGTLVVGYGIPEGLRRELERGGAQVCDSLLDEEFLQDNGFLTALATLGIIITSSDRAVSDMKIGVVGYGRIGRALTEMLLYLGAQVRVYSSRSNMRLELGEQGVSAEISGRDAELGDLSLLINTAPAIIFDTSKEGSFPEGLRVIDLASGENFPGLTGVERYPSVPAKMFPYSAGKIWFESVERYLRDGQFNGGELK